MRHLILPAILISLSCLGLILWLIHVIFETAITKTEILTIALILITAQLGVSALWFRKQKNIKTRSNQNLLVKFQNIALSTELSLEQKADIILETMIELLGADMAYADLLIDEHNSRVMRAGPYNFSCLDDEYHPVYQKIQHSLANEDDIVFWSDDQADEELHSFIGAPVTIGGAPTGHIGFASLNPHMDKPDPDTVTLIKLVAMWVGREITDQRNLSILEANNIKLMDSNRELDDFAYIASHDLKAPVRGMANYAQFLLEDYHDHLDTEGQKMLSSLQDLAVKMDELLSNLLYYSRLGRVDMAMQPTDMGDLCNSVRDMVMAEQEAEAGEVTITIQPDMPVITCDHVRIEEALRNLVTNGLKYNDNADKKIDIGFIPASAKSDFMPVFTVKDNGIGIQEQHQDQVFQIFKRLHRDGDYGGGTGSGLTLVRKILMRHGGRIWLESEYGKGTCFFFTLGNNQI